MFLVSPGPTPALTQTTESGSAGYSNTATTLQLADDEGPAMYSNVVNGIAKTVDFVFRQESNRCFESGTLTRIE